MPNLNFLFNNKFLLLFTIIVFIISLYNLFKHVNNDKYETYNQILPIQIPVKNLSDITESEFNEYVRTIPNNTSYISYDMEIYSFTNGSEGNIRILDENNNYVSNNDTNDFNLEFILYYSNSKDQTKFKPRTIKKITTNLQKLISQPFYNIRFTIDNINFKYYFIGLRLVPINKNYKITYFQPNMSIINTAVKKN